MPSKKQKQKQRGVPDIVDASSLTAESFEKELKALADKAKEQTTFKLAKAQAAVLVKAAAILTLAAIYSNVSQLNLSPVYGAIPASIYHSRAVMAACFIGWSGSLWLQTFLPRKPILYLPVIAMNIPLVQFYLFKFSGLLGAVYGPLVTEALTFLPLLQVSTACVSLELDDLDLSGLWKPVADALPGVGSFAFFRGMEYISGDILRRTIGTTIMQTRLGHQIALGGLYALRLPSNLLIYAIPALLHTALLNTHLQTDLATLSLNGSMNKDGWSLLARQDSVTGYISVFESHKQHFRVMRCDHSLLGGEWLVSQHAGYVSIREPIYAIFTMLEAVRLVKVPVTVPDNEASALVIGLGVGTTPAALIAHGIATTIVEIDPVVYEYATKYFDLPTNHTPIIADAVSYTAHVAQKTTQRFDYIVHDVFTGGAEPVDLFTEEFMQNLYRALKPQGVIAINYAGDILLPSSRLVIRTIKSVFPSCRVYRENVSPSDTASDDPSEDFINMVVFCSKDSSNTILFRKPVRGDYLGSAARKMYLLPEKEIPDKVFTMQEGDVEILRANNTEILTNWQQKSAVGHWNVMRTVIPNNIWESW